MGLRRYDRAVRYWLEIRPNIWEDIFCDQDTTLRADIYSIEVIEVRRKVWVFLIPFLIIFEGLLYVTRNCLSIPPEPSHVTLVFYTQYLKKHFLNPLRVAPSRLNEYW